MNKIFCSLVTGACMFCCIDQQSYAQTLVPFPQPGSVYTEVYIQDASLQYAPVNYSFAYTGDTLVGSYMYAKLSFYPIGSKSPMCTYYDNGRIYLHDSTPDPVNPTGGLLLYDFNLVVGDTFIAPATMNYENYQLPLVVDLVDTITLLNSQTRKHIRLTDGLNVLEWVEGLGDINRGFFYVYGMGLDEEILVCVNDSTGVVWEADMSYYCNPNDPIPNAGANACGIFSYTTSVYDQSCNSCDGIVSLLNVTGGVAPYTYAWSNAGTGSFNVNLCLGQNTVTIYDANGDSCSQSYYIGWNLPDFTWTVDPYPCDGVDTVTIVPLSGVGPFTANWYPQGVWAMSMIIDSSGQYWVMMRDNAFCGIQKPIDIVNLELLQATTQATGISCATCCDGNVNVTISGGHPPFTVTSTPPFPAANNFCQGWYPYCVTDSVGCSYCDSVYVPGVTGINENDINGFDLLPNPAENFVMIRRNTAQPASLMITDVTGKIVSGEMVAGQNLQLDTTRFEAGIYYISIDGVCRELLIVRH